MGGGVSGYGYSHAVACRIMEGGLLVNGTEICVGSTYKQGGCDLHIIALKNQYALIEKHGESGYVLMYIVTSDLYLDDKGDLHWNGSGRYYLFGHGDGKTANDALSEAWSCFMGLTHVYLLVSDDDNGYGVAVYKTYDLALAALQQILDKDEFLQEVAAENDLLPLTAANYLMQQYLFTERTEYFYSIDGRPVIEDVT